ncbi:unnamed protein product [Heterobilharzia americana]|nr:unnamed protein product [Heterobilharzia americana]
MKVISNKLQTFINNCHLRWLDTEDQMDCQNGGNKQQGTVAGQRTNEARTYHPTNMQWKEVEIDWIGHTLRRPTGDITRQASCSSGTPMGSDELGVLGEGDMEEIV